MIFQHTWKKVFDRSKTQTSRLTGNYEVGKSYAIQPGRGMPNLFYPLDDVWEPRKSCKNWIDVSAKWQDELTA